MAFCYRLRGALLPSGVVVGSGDGNVYALHPDGTEKWRFDAGGSVASSPSIGPDGTVYVGSDTGRIYAIRGGSGGLADTAWPMFRRDAQHSGYGAPLPVGGTISGNQTGVLAICLNTTQGANAMLQLGGAVSWDCEGAGLPVNLGDVVIQLTRGVVTGPELTGGTVTGVSGLVAGCHNLTTGQRVTLRLGGGVAWDCAGAGLAVSNGDRISTVSVGNAN